MNQVCITYSRFQNCKKSIGMVFGYGTESLAGRMVPHIKHGRMVLDVQLNLQFVISHGVPSGSS
jgi:hypothetical protein